MTDGPDLQFTAFGKHQFHTRKMDQGVLNLDHSFRRQRTFPAMSLAEIFHLCHSIRQSGLQGAEEIKRVAALLLLLMLFPLAAPCWAQHEVLLAAGLLAKVRPEGINLLQRCYILWTAAQLLRQYLQGQIIRITAHGRIEMHIRQALFRDHLHQFVAGLITRQFIFKIGADTGRDNMRGLILIRHHSALCAQKISGHLICQAHDFMDHQAAIFHIALVSSEENLIHRALRINAAIKNNSQIAVSFQVQTLRQSTPLALFLFIEIRIFSKRPVMMRTLAFKGRAGNLVFLHVQMFIKKNREGNRGPPLPFAQADIFIQKFDRPYAVNAASPDKFFFHLCPRHTLKTAAVGNNRRKVRHAGSDQPAFAVTSDMQAIIDDVRPRRIDRNAFDHRARRQRRPYALMRAEIYILNLGLIGTGLMVTVAA